MQTKLSNYTIKDKLYFFFKRVVEIFISLSILFCSSFIMFYFIARKMINQKEIFTKKEFFLNENENITLSFFNCKNLFIKNLSLFYYVLISKLYLVGVALIVYKPNITYKVNEKAGLCSLWFIRKNSKMPNITISSCNKEYLENRTLVNDLKIICKGLISLIYFNENNNYKEKIKIFDIEFDNLSMNNIISLITNTIETNTKRVIYFINADCLNKTFNNTQYKNILKEANTILADGSGINIACNILKTPLKENLNGTDMLPFICTLANNQEYKIFLLGAKENVALKMKEELEKKYPNIQIVGAYHGYLKNAKEEEQMINKINQSKAKILFVAMGAPNQEIFIEKYKDVLGTNIIFGVGGLFDFYSKNIKRAPLYLREIGFEWIFRMIQEPRRMWKRYILGNPLFIYRVIRYKKELEQNSLINIYLNNYEKPKKYRIKKSIWKIGILSHLITKRVIDILGSIFALILLSPLLIVVMLIIKLSSKGNIFFVQKRVGINGRLFNMYKFRSMVIDAEELKQKLMEQNQSKDGVTFKIKDDPRITKIGKFIRKTSIDELPQLLNVLKGEMSLVGPRPPIIDEVKQYNIDDKKRLDVKPGITCIWQVSGRSKIPFKEQVKMDKEYIKNQSILKDIILLLKTIPAVLFQKGSY